MKYASLLKKVNGFEKLALYSNRTSFLKALASNMVSADKLTPDVRADLESVLKNVDALDPNSTELQNKIMDALHNDTVDLDDLIQTIHTATNQFPEGHGPQINQALDLTIKLQKLLQDQEQTTATLPASPGSFTQPSTTKPAGLPTIDKTVQDKLNTLLVPSGEIMPLKVDGLLGDRTKSAIEAFKKKYNVPGNYTLPQVLQVIKSAK
jgi:peptidoglycan hydrolase-like protein with peptidoglycan-binding domain